MKKYIYTFVIVFILGAIIYSIYTEINKPKISVKAKRLECQKRVTSFERAYDKEQLTKAQTLLKNGNFIISHGIDKAKYMNSTLFDLIDMEKLTSQLKTKLNKSDKITKDDIKIEYKVYENDTEDPKKKSDNCKFFRGYVVLKVLNKNNKLIYQVQIDFMDFEGKDIPATLDCAVKSFLTYK